MTDAVWLQYLASLLREHPGLRDAEPEPEPEPPPSYDRKEGAGPKKSQSEWTKSGSYRWRRRPEGGFEIQGPHSIIILCDTEEELKAVLGHSSEQRSGQERQRARKKQERCPTSLRTYDRAARGHLGLKNGATPDDVKHAYRELAKAHHPDHGGDRAAFEKVARAKNWLLKRAQGWSPTGPADRGTFPWPP